MSFLDLKERNKAFKFVLPVVVWMAVIFSFSSLPTVTTSNFYLWDFLLKKTAHFVEYGVLATLIYRALVNYDVKSSRAVVISIVCAFIYGLSDEFHQSFVPGRGPKFTDTLIDSFGAWLFVYVFINKFRAKLPNVLQSLFLRFGL